MQALCLAHHIGAREITPALFQHLQHRHAHAIGGDVSAVRQIGAGQYFIVKACHVFMAGSSDQAGSVQSFRKPVEMMPIPFSGPAGFITLATEVEANVMKKAASSRCRAPCGWPGR
jgi:hypothetical protein